MRHLHVPPRVPTSPDERADAPLLPSRTLGVKGTAPIRLAVESGELAGACFNWVSMRSAWQHALETGEVIVVLQLAAEALPDLPAVPLVRDVAKTDEARKLVSTAIYRASGLARPYALPPGTPPERIDLLRRAFLATLRDPEFLTDAKRARLEVSPLSGEEVERLVAGCSPPRSPPSPGCVPSSSTRAGWRCPRWR
jgi:hypothetical protein